MRRVAVIVIIALSLGAAASAETPADAAGRAFEAFGRALQRLTGLDAGAARTETEPFRARRAVDHHFPAAAGATVSVDNPFGPVRVTGWDERVVSVTAVIHAAAGSTDAARSLADSVAVESEARGGNVAVRTVPPEALPGDADAWYAAAYTVQAPRNVSIVVHSRFGDVEISDFDGAVVADTAHGGLSLDRLRGEVDVRARGCMPVRLGNLGGPGRLSLIDCRTVLGPGASGALEIRVDGGSLDLEADTGDADQPLHLRASGSDVALRFPAGHFPPVEARLLHAVLRGMPPRPPQTFGPLLWMQAEQAPPRYVLDLAFGSLTLVPADTPAAPAPREAASPGKGNGDTELFVTSEMQERTLNGETRLVVDAEGARLRLRAVEAPGTETVRVAVRRELWAASAAEAAAALETLPVRLRLVDGAVRVEQAVVPPPGQDAPRHAMTLEIAYPARLEVQVDSAAGDTRVEQAAALVRVSQGSGRVDAVACRGPLVLSAGTGTASAADCVGDCEITAGGGASVSGHTGALTIRAGAGGAVVERHRGPANVTVTGGGARFYNPEHIEGGIEAHVTGGDLRFHVPETGDADLAVTVTDGSVRSAIRLTGTVQGEQQTFNTLTGAGTHRVRLQVSGGDVYITGGVTEAAPEE